MELSETVTSFLKDRKDDRFYDSSVVTYKRKLEVFSEFLKQYFSFEGEECEIYLIKINNDTIIESISYYVNEYNIKFKTTVDHYFTVIKCYFEYIYNDLNIKNENLNSKQNSNALNNLVDKKIIELKLNPSKQKSPITEVCFKNLNDHCNSIINSISLDEVKTSNNILKIFISAIIVKIVMLTGIKNKVIESIKCKDYDSELNRIRINSYWIHLPNELGKQLKKYIEFRNAILISVSLENPLFINHNGTIDTDSNYNRFIALEKIMKNRAAESVAKLTIMNLIQIGISSSIIQKLTTFGECTYSHCQELLDEDKGVSNFICENRILDSKIRSMDNFDML